MDRSNAALGRTLLLCASLLVTACAPSPTTQESADLCGLQPVAFMAGTWQTQSQDTITQEHWSTPLGGMMLGTSMTVKGNQMVFFEFFRIEKRESGLVYLAQPKGRPATEFMLTASDHHSATFTNPEHDFPKRIQYRRDGDTLLATIDGASSPPQKGAAPAQTWMLRRLREP